MRIQSRASHMRATFNYQRACLNLLNSGENASASSIHRMDSFQRSSLAGDTALFSASAKLASRQLQGKVSDEMLDAFNFYDPKLKYLDGNRFEYDGVTFSADQLRRVPESRCKEIKAEDNVIRFEAGTYYKYKRPDGTTDIMCSSTEIAHMTALYSDQQQSGVSMESAKDTAWYWNMMQEGSCPLTSMQISLEEERQMLDDAGIKQGFFTIERPHRTDTFFRTNGPYTNAKVSQKEYDGTYRGFTQGGFLRDYNPGDICTVDGKEYVIDENKHIDIPYGADIFVVEYPHERAKRLADSASSQQG